MKHNLEEIDQLSLGFENWKPIKHNLLWEVLCVVLLRSALRMIT